MSADVVIFHSSEVNDPTLLAEGWYIGTPRGDTLTTEGAIGPFPTQKAAAAAAATGAWLRSG